MELIKPLVNRFQGKVAIVTGGGRGPDAQGIGSAIAERFAAEGSAVCIVDLSKERAQATADMFMPSAVEPLIVEADCTKEDQCQEAIARAVTRFGRVDVLVNNLGIAGGAGAIEKIAISELQRILAINLTSAILMSKFSLPHLKQSKGNIVNIGSIAGIRSYGSSIPYAATKAALQGFTNEMAVMYGKDGIRVNLVAPGHLFTPIVRGHFNEEMQNLRRKVAALPIEGKAEDVAAAVLFLASEDARFITATCLPVDGGASQVGGMAAAMANQADE